MTTTNTMGGGDLRLPSGSEVESAAFHIPATGEEWSGSLEPARRSGFRGKLDDVKERGIHKVHELQHSLEHAKMSMRDRVSQTSVSVRGGVNDGVTKMQTSMKSSPMLWAGIAAGSGFALGLLGRFVHWRNYHRRMTPDLVIIDATC